jgi:hypothetical protein
MDIRSKPERIPFERAIDDAIDIRERGRAINEAECCFGKTAEATSGELRGHQGRCWVRRRHDAIGGQTSLVTADVRERLNGRGERDGVRVHSGESIAVQNRVFIPEAVGVRPVGDPHSPVAVPGESFDHMRKVVVLPHPDPVHAVVVGQTVLESPKSARRLRPVEAGRLHLSLDAHGDAVSRLVPLTRSEKETGHPETPPGRV